MIVFQPAADMQRLLAVLSSLTALPSPLASVDPSGYVVMPAMTPRLPPMPARPTDAAGAGFYDHAIVPLYAAEAAFWAAVAAA
jgi:hypothetical protein